MGEARGNHLPREDVTQGGEENEGLQTKAQRLNYVLLSQRKILIGSFLEICQYAQGNVITQGFMADRLQVCIDQLPKIDAFKPKQIEALEALFAGRDNFWAIMAIVDRSPSFASFRLVQR